MINNININTKIDPYLLGALSEDITNEDVTTNSILKTKTNGTAELLCKEDGVLSGVKIFQRVFSLLGDISFEMFFNDGDTIKNGDIIATISGDMRVILSGERVALNYLQRMSGISTKTRKFTAILQDSSTKLLDTRKTTPNMRIFEKYAVKVGGGLNHRYNLSDGVLLKDNHISAAGSIKTAVKMARNYAPFVRKIEIEVETLDMVREALSAEADIIMLDNMDNKTMKAAIELIANKAQTECSGNITKERLIQIKGIGVDFVSSGSLTHSANILDFSIANLKPL